MQSAFWCYYYYYYYYYYAAFNAPCVGHNSFRVLFDKIASVYFLEKKCIYILALEMPSPGNQHCMPIVSAHFRSYTSCTSGFVGDVTLTHDGASRDGV